MTKVMDAHIGQLGPASDPPPEGLQVAQSVPFHCPHDDQGVVKAALGLQEELQRRLPEMDSLGAGFESGRRSALASGEAGLFP